MIIFVQYDIDDPSSYPNRYTNIYHFLKKLKYKKIKQIPQGFPKYTIVIK